MSKQVIIEFRAELDQFKSQLKSAQDELAKLKKKGEDAGDGVAKGAEGASKSTKQLIGTLKQLASAVGLAFGAREIINFTREAVTLAGKLQGVEAAFKRIGDERLLEGLRQATRGTVSDLQLMQSAVRASNFEIPLEQLASLFEFARRRAKETGEEVDYLVESIILGIGRKSPLILDNLGISAVRLRQELNGVSAEAATVGDVAEVVGKIASEAMLNMGEETETAADKQQRLAAEFINLKIAIGTSLLPQFNSLLEVLNKAAETLLFFVSGIDKAEKALIDEARVVEENTIQAYQKRIDQMIEEGKVHELINRMRQQGIEVDDDAMAAGALYAAMLEDRKKQLEDERIELQKLADLQGASHFDLGQMDWNVQLAITDEKLAAINSELNKMAKAREDMEAAAQGEANTLKAYEEQIKALKELVNTTEIGTAEYYKYKQQLADVEAEYKRLTMTQEDLAKIEEERLKRMRAMQQVLRESLQAERESIPDTSRFQVEGDAFIDMLNGEILTRAEYNERLLDMQSEQAEREKEQRDKAAEDSLADTQYYLEQGRQMYIDYGMTEAEYTEYSMMLMKKRADFLLQQGAITREEYEKIMRTITEQSQASAEQVFESMAMLTTSFRDFTLAVSKDFSDKRLQMSQAELLSLVKAGELTAMEYEKIVENQEKLARFNKAMAFFEITFNTAKALSNVIASNSATGPLAPITIAKGVAVVLAGMAQVAAVLAQANPPSAPRFEKGGWIGGRSHADGGTLIEAEAGEYIINKRDARANKDILKAINTGNLSKYVVRHYVEPLTRSMAADKNSLAENIAASLAEQMGMHGNYLRKLTKGVRITNPQDIARSMKQPKVNRFNN